jgi:hypothetical protein
MDISGLSIMLSRTGTRPESADTESPMPEKYPLPAPPETMPATEGYNAIKDNALKEVLMRLEKSIAAKESANAAS